MHNHVNRWIQAFIIISCFLVGCTLQISGSPTSSSLKPDYTTAAQTIAAQLTLGAESGTAFPAVQLPSETTATDVMTSVPEKLPDTSTPLPTKTPIPSNLMVNTPTFTATTLPTVAQITPTSADDLAASLGNPDFTDDFVDGSNWFVFTDEHVSVDVSENHLTMTLANADKYEAMMLSTQPILEDFHMEVTTKTGDCRGLDRYGLIVRAPGFDPIQGYLFGFTCDGQYSIRVYDGIGFTAIIPWTPSEHILAGPDQTNRLGFSASGQQLSLYANGTLLLELQDDRYPSGYFGFFVGAYTTPGFNVSFSKFAYWLLP